MLWPQMYTDSSVVMANVSDSKLSPSGMKVDEFKDRAVKENGLFVLREEQDCGDGEIRENVRCFQDANGRLPLSEVDSDARWRTSRPSRRPSLSYQENVFVESGGFIVARKVAHASEGEWKAVSGMLERLPVKPETLAADTAYKRGKLETAPGETWHICLHPDTSEPGSEHGRKGRLRLPGRSSALPTAQEAAQEHPPQ